MKSIMNTENLTSNERNARAAIGIFAVIAAMESSLAGSPVFAAINIMAIALVTTAIVGWDPLKALLKSATHSEPTHKVPFSDQRV